MRVRTKQAPTGWKPAPDSDDRFSSGIPDFDRLLGGGFRRGSMALFAMDETVRKEDVDLLLFPTFLNMLYQSRGIIAVLPSRDSPHDFRARMTRYVTRRRFDSRVRVVDYIGEDADAPYVVSLVADRDDPLPDRPSIKKRKAAIQKMVAAEKVVRGGRKRPFLEIMAFETFETLMGVDKSLRMFYYGIKRARDIGNLAVGLLGPGLGSAAGVRRMADTEFALHRDEVGLLVRGVHPSFPAHVVAHDMNAGPPHVAFVPRPK